MERIERVARRDGTEPVSAALLSRLEREQQRQERERRRRDADDAARSPSGSGKRSSGQDPQPPRVDVRA